MTRRVTIVGGGITGLAAAYELHRRGAPFTLLESSDRLGGIVRTDQVHVPALGDLVVDAGPDAMLARKRAGIALCEEVGIANRLVPSTPPRRAFIVRDGALQPLPPLHERARSAAAKEDESIAEHFARRFGQDAVDFYAEPLLAGIHAGDVDRLSVRALFPELLEDAPGRPVDPEGAFRSFPRGMQELVDAIVGALPADQIHTNAPATAAGDHLALGPVILAVPAAAAAELLAALDPELAGLCRSIRYASSGIVVLGYPRSAVDHPLDGSGFVVPRVERATRILAATWLSSKWPGRAPAGTALMRAFFGGDRDPHAVTLPDQQLAAMAHDDLARLLRITGEPAWRRVYRWFESTPQYEVGYLRTLAAIRARAARHPGLLFAGAGFGSIGIPDCIESGRAAAAAAVGGDLRSR